MFHFLHYFLQNSRKTYGKYRKSTEGKNNMGTDREIMHLCQVNKIGQYKPVDDFDKVVIRNNVQEF